MVASAALENSVPRGDRLSKRNFDRLARYIYAYSGIRMPHSKTTMLEGRLRRRLRVTGHGTLDEYCRYLFEGDGIEGEAVALIDAVTTNKTDFFREPNHFAHLRDVILPEFLEKGGRSLNAWSAACSTGAEPYTIAMVLEEAVRMSNFNYSILATDLSTEVLATAIKGIYPADMMDPVPRDIALRYVMRSIHPGARKVRIHPQLRARIGFARMNLMSESYPVGEEMDLLFCRNVLIYFDKPTQGAVLRRLCACLKPGGHLFVGHSESVVGFDLPLQAVAGTVLKKV